MTYNIGGSGWRTGWPFVPAQDDKYWKTGTNFESLRILSNETVLCSFLQHQLFYFFPKAQSRIQSSTIQNLQNYNYPFPNCQQTKLSSTSPATRKTNYDKETKWIVTVCFSWLFLMGFQSATRQPNSFPVAWDIADRWKSMVKVTFHSSLGNPVAYLSPRPEIYWLWGHVHHLNAWGTNTSLNWGWHFIYSTPIY